MKKIIISLVSVLAVSTIFASQGSISNFSGNLSFGMTGNTLSATSGGTEYNDNSMDMGLTASGNGFYNLNKHALLGLGVRYNNGKINNSCVSSIPLYMIFQYNFNNLEGIIPYLNVQIGGAATTITGDSKTGGYFGLGAGLNFNPITVSMNISATNVGNGYIKTNSGIIENVSLNLISSSLEVGYSF